ncbi:MAG: hypothetical protein M1114_04110 [Candidatus Dependentiae bacterium]|nr:hypothetical protein [Candidatus Dependentiae bacterium]
MKYSFSAYLFFIFASIFSLYPQEQTMVMQMTLAEEKLLSDAEYAELLVNILPKELKGRINSYYSGYEVLPLLILNPQGLKSADVAKAMAQTRYVKFLHIDDKYFSLADNIDFFSAIVKDIDAFLCEGERVVVLIDGIDGARSTTYKSLRIEKLVNLLRNRKILTILTAHEEGLIDDVIMAQIPSADIFDCAKISLESRVKIIKFCFKKNIDAGIVDEKLIQTVAQKTGDFSYSRLYYLVHEINHFIKGRSLQHIVEADVLRFISKEQAQIDRYKKGGIKTYFKKVSKLVNKKRIAAQIITDTIALSSAVGLIFLAGKALNKINKWDAKRSGKHESIDEIVEQLNSITTKLRQRLEALNQQVPA